MVLVIAFLLVSAEMTTPDAREEKIRELSEQLGVLSDQLEQKEQQQQDLILMMFRKGQVSESRRKGEHGLLLYTYNISTLYLSARTIPFDRISSQAVLCVIVQATCCTSYKQYAVHVRQTDAGGRSDQLG